MDRDEEFLALHNAVSNRIAVNWFLAGILFGILLVAVTGFAVTTLGGI